MKRLVIGLLSVVALAFAAPAAADAPTEFPILDVFEDVTVTFTGTFFVHEHDSRVVVRGERTITTSDGFVGHGTDSFVDNGQVVVFRQADILTNASGDHFRARGLFVLDLSTDTVRIESFELTCLGP
jgi:type 1 fimbria pilin